ncbi:MAG: 3,4-dihydroxy-2-butanone-4-phosphate synthase [Candidatus Omnitrophota bacterium]
MAYQFDTVEEALKDIRAGKLVIVLDGKNREYEGDFIGAASMVTPETINFLVSYAKGAFVAVFMPAGRCDQLDIPPMGAGKNTSFNQTKFRLAVDAKKGGSGSSAIDRAMTVKLLGLADTKAEDFVRPGHVVPIEASGGGVVARPGHTEAGVELMRLAGIEPPVAVDLEILDDDGSMAHEEKLFELAKKFKIRIITIESLIAFVKSKPACTVSR